MNKGNVKQVMKKAVWGWLDLFSLEM